VQAGDISDEEAVGGEGIAVALVQHLIAQIQVHVAIVAMMATHVELADTRVIQRLAALIPGTQRPAHIHVHLFAAGQMTYEGLQLDQFRLVVGEGKLIKMMFAAVVDALLQGERALMPGTEHRIAGNGPGVELAAIGTMTGGAGVAVVTGGMKQHASLLHGEHAGILEFIILHPLHLFRQIGIAGDRLLPCGQRQRQQAQQQNESIHHRSVTR
jgi:hypothetical protein